MPFSPGISGNPAGRPVGIVSGRAKTLALLDELLSAPGNQARLQDSLQDYFEKSPVRFFRQIVMPLLPQNLKLELTPQAAPWGKLDEKIREMQRAAALNPAITISADPA